MAMIPNWTIQIYSSILICNLEYSVHLIQCMILSVKLYYAVLLLFINSFIVFKNRVDPRRFLRSIESTLLVYSFLYITPIYSSLPHTFEMEKCWCSWLGFHSVDQSNLIFGVTAELKFRILVDLRVHIIWTLLEISWTNEAWILNAWWMKDLFYKSHMIINNLYLGFNWKVC